MQEIAAQYDVSFCPAQKALKALDREGLVSACRGRKTVVLRKPYAHYLESGAFRSRVNALADLTETLKLISSSLCFQGCCHMDGREPAEAGDPGKRLYRLFGQSLQALGSRTVRSLYDDIGAFVESGFLDSLQALYGKEEAGRYLRHLTESFRQSIRACREGRLDAGKEGLEGLERDFFNRIGSYLRQLPSEGKGVLGEPFRWEPNKGRVKYCDVIAVDLLRKINQGAYPVGSLLPNVAILADVYHVSGITIRRTVCRLNQLDVTQTRNGVGTAVIHTGDATTLKTVKGFLSDDYFRGFLEALQLLAVTCEAVLPYTFPQLPAASLEAIARATQLQDPQPAMVAAIGAVLQAVVHHCPLAAVRELYGKMTLLLLGGSLLQLWETGWEAVNGWPDISFAIAQSLKARDGRRFAAAFSRLAEEAFILSKRMLCAIGVEQAAKVRDPVHVSIQRPPCGGSPFQESK